jgi:sulfur-oxidizing protein SoxX
MDTKKIATVAGLAMALAGCASMLGEKEDYSAKAVSVMKASFKEHGQAKLDRLDRDEVQQVCSQYYGDAAPPKEVAERLEKSQQALIKYPADGNLLGNWQSGERIAQSGVGMQYTDDPALPAGANCYACHELTPAEMSYGTIGPSLRNFGKVRGFTPEMQKYAYGRIYNAQAFSACSNMPRFGAKGILTEQQIKDLVALLMDPKSPVNQ